MSQSPYLLMTPAEAARIRNHLKAYSPETDLLCRSVARLEAGTRAYIAEIGVEIPGHGEGGGYEHNRHKQNYIELNNASQLWLITEDRLYLEFCVEMLCGYAERYPGLTLNISRDSNPPGRLFHQTLNENMWLMYASLAYACVKSEMAEVDRQLVENQLLREMVTLFTDTYGHDFDIIHNHGLWAVAGVGVCGFALEDDAIADQAIYGLKGDGESGGFMAQLKNLFSPDGYYMEGPYYHRFAIRPLLILAEVIARKRPQLDIYQFENAVIERTTGALMSTAYPDGTFPALNDSSRTIGINDEGLVVAASLCYQRYGASDNLVAMAQLQNQVWLAAGSIELSLAAQSDPKPLDWGSLTLNDGASGDKGGLGILRRQLPQDQHMLTLWYGQHGSDHTLHSALDHGHFDGLSITWFNCGQEVLKEYGYGRWVNVEPKFGGRYIPENKSYCKQTVAHNTVVVDQGSQNRGDTATAERHWGELALFLPDAEFGQLISARAVDYYPGVDMQRTLVLLDRPQGSPLLVDLFELCSEQPHQYDLPVHYEGQITHTNFDYQTPLSLQPLGESAGYQHLWHQASAATPFEEPSAMVSWLMGDSYYSLNTAVNAETELLFARIGANDPAFNLRSEPALIIRQRGSNHLFATVYEQHGYFNESLELSEQARGRVQSVRVLCQSPEVNVVEIVEASLGRCLICYWKGDNPEAEHQLRLGSEQLCWQGAVALLNPAVTGAGQ